MTFGYFGELLEHNPEIYEIVSHELSQCPKTLISFGFVNNSIYSKTKNHLLFPFLKITNEIYDYKIMEMKKDIIIQEMGNIENISKYSDYLLSLGYKNTFKEMVCKSINSHMEEFMGMLIFEVIHITYYIYYFVSYKIQKQYNIRKNF